MKITLLKFAQRIIILHLILLLVLGAFITLGAVSVARRLREKALDDAKAQQSLLAGQTARGIADFYQGILDDLNLFRYGDEEPHGGATQAASQPAQSQLPPVITAREVAPRLAGRIIWKQLEGRAAEIFVIDQNLGRVISRSEAAPVEPERIYLRHEEWLKTLRTPAISGFTQFTISKKATSKEYAAGDTLGGNLVWPAPLPDDRLVVALVPADQITQRFLGKLAGSKDFSASLIDNDLTIVAATDSNAIGHNIQSVSDPRIRQTATAYVKDSRTGSEVLEPFDFNGQLIPQRLVTVESIDMPGKNWSLFLASPMADVNSFVNTVLRDAMRWAIFVVVSMTAVLVSTAVQVIRSRARLEKLRHEILTRELAQARDIQLAWLPDAAVGLEGAEIAASNTPASHISGDFYDWFQLENGHLVVTIGDVTGHGMGAAFLMATTQLLVRTTLQRVHDPGKCLEEVNKHLCLQHFNGQFVTILVLVINPATRQVQGAAAGHLPPLMSDGKPEYAGGFKPVEMETQLVLGVMDDMEYATQTFALPEDAWLVLYTDGVLDARAENGGRFSAELLRQCLQGPFESAQEIVETVTTRLDNFRSGADLNDDLTLVALRLAAQPAAKIRELVTA